MQIQIKRPNPDYPFVWAHIEVSSRVRATPEKATEIDRFLGEIGIFLLGKWEAVDEHDLRAPALLIDEYFKQVRYRTSQNN